MAKIAFYKMHGLGNDFVVVDRRRQDVAIGAQQVRWLADRHIGVGCDQVILIEEPHDSRAAAYMQIRNADGSEAEACGNATRCVAWLLGRENGARRIGIETVAGVLDAELCADGNVSVDMGEARIAWREIPLSRETDTARVDLALGPLAEPVCSNIGNPHATFFVADVNAIDLAALGPELEHHMLFPQRANIGIATIIDRTNLRLRAWERGAGITRACGSGACAAVVAAHRRGLTERRARVRLDGGELDIDWREDGHVVMSGPVALSFAGTVDAALLRAAKD
jgi:diaminopimelate epimerase